MYTQDRPPFLLPPCCSLYGISYWDLGGKREREGKRKRKRERDREEA
jgi:hypothetical protein